MSCSIIILAAGKGTRMGNNAPKVLCKLGEKSLIKHVLDTAEKIQNRSTYLVVGYEAEQVKEETKDYDLTYVMQHDQLGTGHAVIQVAPHLTDSPHDNILILSGIVPSFQLKPSMHLLRIILKAEVLVLYSVQN